MSSTNAAKLYNALKFGKRGCEFTNATDFVYTIFDMDKKYKKNGSTIMNDMLNLEYPDNDYKQWCEENPGKLLIVEVFPDECEFKMKYEKGKFQYECC